MSTPATVRMCAKLVANRIDTKNLANSLLAASDPYVTAIGANGRGFVFREGVVATLGAAPEEETAFLQTLAPRLRDPLPQPVSEEATLVVREESETQDLPDGVLAVRNLEVARMSVVAEVLAKAAALNYFEPIVESALGRAEHLASELARDGKSGANLQELGRRMGEALLVEHRLVGRAAVAEKPDLLWDHPDLERLYGRLEAEYELRERALVIDRKLEALRTTAGFVTELVQNRRAQLLEWAIIGLICFEILVSLVTAMTQR